MSSLKIVSGDAVHQPTWPLLLKIEHMVKLQVLGNNITQKPGHVGWCTASPETILRLDILVMIQTKFGFHWSSTFRGEDF
jgi:hypothetical protein